MQYTSTHHWYFLSVLFVPGNAFSPLGCQISPDGQVLGYSWLCVFVCYIIFPVLRSQCSFGFQLPAEEARTNSGGYVNFATMGLLQLGLISRNPLLGAQSPSLCHTLSLTTQENELTFSLHSRKWTDSYWHCFYCWNWRFIVIITIIILKLIYLNLVASGAPDLLTYISQVSVFWPSSFHPEFML